MVIRRTVHTKVDMVTITAGPELVPRESVATSGDLNHHLVEYENTYKLDPDAVFFPGKVKAIIKEVLEENLKGQTYKANLMASRCMALSDIIKERVRQLEMPRFKTVVLVLVGENKEQALSVASQCLWNKETDNFASCEYSKGNLHVVAMVFGVYQE
ncbi:hypothetical protein EGW08_001647 [Elysia chlorotica]|uniref:Uncharacterized protein n=1 Tax=Elysia chlorotica TaxID=188477 RepID=A0A433U9T4_ELYCH|nr:hypothetical protein EGW08_001647 [Elysia chlorotica]